MDHKKITILALGGTGCRVIRQINGNNFRDNVRLLAIDTDGESLIESGLPRENCLLAAQSWRNGQGCGGDVTNGRNALAAEIGNLTHFFSGTEFLLVVAGLGGGLATGGLSVVAREVRKLHIPQLLLLTMPFEMEGQNRRHFAEEALAADLLNCAEAVVTIPNDLLFSTQPASTPLLHAFEMVDAELARCVVSLALTLTSGNLLTADFANLMELIHKRKSICGLGVGRVDASVPAEERPGKLVTQLLDSPLLGGTSQLAAADAVIFSIVGGPELSMGETREILELAKRCVGKKANVLLSASTDPDWSGKLQLTALTVKYEEEVIQQPDQTAKVHSQTQLPLFNLVNKGEMESTTAVVWNNQDLDEPAFVRRNLTVDAGKRK